jgi:hypothetical protein
VEAGSLAEGFLRELMLLPLSTEVAGEALARMHISMILCL